MKAFITSIGEVTTDLCVWSLERNGFEVVLVKDSSRLGDKLRHIYDLADNDFVRVDADIVVNRNLTPKVLQTVPVEYWWMQYQTYDWFKQDVAYGGVQVIRKEALPLLRKRAMEFRFMERPETMLSRIEEFHNPRRFQSEDTIMGLNGYKAADVDRIKKTKLARDQYDNYDWELAGKLDEL